MGRFGRIVDAGILLAETIIERIGDPHVIRDLRITLGQRDLAAAHLVEENERLEGHCHALQRRVELLEDSLRSLGERVSNAPVKLSELERASIVTAIDEALYPYDGPS